MKNQGLTLSYGNTIRMAENYLPAFKMEKSNQFKINSNYLNSICHDIDVGKHFIRKSSCISNYITSVHEKNYKYSRGVGVTNDFSISSDCKGCGTCVKVCPTNNIKIINEKPVFSSDCLSCFACTQNCPNKAIILKTEKSGERYRNPNISLDEIMKSNE